ncbi:MAG: hypothetical protein EPO55_25080 [Reyranella sp.]|uniref:hypothetical protein n=1 Tax=Reyranella sp. TaxID=1929291 RepID=UPI00120ACA13|nr:hypothetical protein [Reyranella sp.]TAJ35736.1 MAG: hypothetical protein EPO55_25080 [Reyranella sp.]
MNNTAFDTELKDFVADCEAGRAEDWLGLVVIANFVRRHCGITDNDEVKRLSLTAVRALMERGFRAGQFKRYGDSKLILWPDQTPDAVVARIDKEWDPAKGDPNINDICWFE